MHAWLQFKEHIPQIEKNIGILFKNKDLLCLSFVHKSYFNEHHDLVQNSNERLEFLGDAILNTIICVYLYESLPGESEGRLSHFKALAISSYACALYFRKLDIEKYILLGKGEATIQDRGKSTIFADAFEALIGAIYLDQGFLAAQSFFLRHFENEIKKIIQAPLTNHKAELQDYSQKKYKTPPEYHLIKEEGVEHRKIFTVAVSVDGKEIGQGVGPSKKVAEQMAAKQALEKINRQEKREE